MIICEAPQGTPEWRQERAGAITASMFSEVRARLKSGPNKGDFTKAAHDYAFRLAIERISGESIDDGGMDTWAMRRGRELEPEARAAHEFRHDVEVVECGLVLTDDRLFGASADGLIGDDGGAEYKCLVSPDRLARIILNKDISEFADQVQGCMWVTGRSWWHFGLYAPFLSSVQMDLVIHEVKRNDDYIEQMERDLMEFNRLVDSYKQQIIDAPSFIRPE